MGENSMIAFGGEATLLTNQGNTKQPQALDLVFKLCNALAVEEIDYCHWKSNSALDRSASGDNDLDLLVSRIHAQHFAEILHGLGFKETFLPRADQLPGVRDYYGYDQKTGKLVHVHAHFQLILGNDLSKNYRLPLEHIYLESSVQGELFRIPAPEFELVILVIRMVLKHSTWDSILMRHGRLSKSEQHELVDLATDEILSRVEAVLVNFPGLSQDLFDLCLQSLEPECPYWIRIKAGNKLQKVLQACARRPHWLDVSLKFSRRIWPPILRHGFRYAPKSYCANGGLFIAIIGGDGAGKTTIIDELFLWLSDKFETTKFHMGKPAWSWTTIALRGILKIGTILRVYPFEGDIYEEAHQPHGIPWFIRTVCTARDRYLTYVRARRLSSNGKLVLCDRYSLPGYMAMDGPQCEQAITLLEKASWAHFLLAKLEMSYYEQIKLPDLLIVLKLEPELAIQRKREESEESVRARSTEVWELEWSGIPAFAIDAGLMKEDVISQVKELAWAHL
jgi:thymidylate kinase